MSPEQQMAEMHADVKSILNERLPSIDQRLTRIETHDSVVRGFLTSIWGAVAGAIVSLLIGRPHS